MTKMTIGVEEYKQLVATKIKHDLLLDGVLDEASINDKGKLDVSGWQVGETIWDIVQRFEKERVATKLAELKEIKEKEENMAPVAE